MPKSSKNLLTKRQISIGKKWLTRIIILLVVYTSICIFILFQQQRLIFWPYKIIEHNPSLYNLNYQDIWLPVTTKDGKVEKIHGWWIPTAKPQAPVLLYLHHNAINIGANVSQARNFNQLGYSVLLIDYRGFGRSGGKFPTEYQVYQDAEIAWNYLTQKRRIPSKQIFIYGHSVGGALAIDLAVNHPEAAGLIVQNSFTNLQDITKRFGLYWLFPVKILLNQKFDSLKKIRNLRIPVLFIHGTDDPQIPAQMSQRLFDATPAPKKLLLIPKAGHDNHMERQYYQVVRHFIEKVQNSYTQQNELLRTAINRYI